MPAPAAVSGLASASPAASDLASPAPDTASPVDSAGTRDSEASRPARPDGVIKLAVLAGGVCTEWEGTEALAELGRAVGHKGARVWVDLRSPSAEQVAIVSRILRLHPLLAEDLTERDQRAKLEQVGDTVHLVLFALGFDDGSIYEREIEFVLGEGFLLSSHSAWWEPR